MSPRTGLGLVGAGVVLALAGLAGGFVFAEDDGDAAAPDPTTTSSTTATTTTSAPPSSTTVAPSTTADRAALIDEQAVRAFYDVFTTAVRSGDSETLLDRLHPAVFARYGDEQCRAFVEARFDNPEFSFDVVEVGAPEDWVWVRDEVSSVVPEAVAVQLVQRAGEDADPVEQEAHVALDGDEIAWFTDCGEPVG